jgi:branched-chain amino acid transport system ATP-binding protein
MTAPVGIGVKNVTVAFDGVKALDGVTIDIAGGAITGLIGPNGSGKSTLVNLISGQKRPSAGSVLLGSVAITGQRADRIVRLGVARTFQIPNVPRQLTIEEVISVPFFYVRRRGRLPENLRSAASIARFCGIKQDIGALCGELSVPDLRRLEIARALACGPSVLLLDEVMAGLSLDDAAQVIDLVRRLNAAGMTIVVIEHVMRIISELCHEVVVLNHGVLLAAGRPDAVLKDSKVGEAYLGRGATS